MAEVVGRLRQTSPEAANELEELYLAVREIAVNGRLLESGLREVTAEAAALAAIAEGASATRLKSLATCTAILLSSAEQSASILVQLRDGMGAWGISVP